MEYVNQSPVRDAVNRVSTDLFSLAYRYGVKKAIFAMAPDDAHARTLAFCHAAGKNTPLMWLLRSMLDYTDPVLETNVMGVRFSNPFGISAGLDKNCDIAPVADAAGYGFETVGSVTGRPCAGNPRPWFHRLPQYESMMVHVGLANAGSEAVIRDVEKAYTHARQMKISVSIARTNDDETIDDEEGIEDYRLSLERAAGKSDMVEINISCPNTMVGERFVAPENLDRLLTALDSVDHPQPVLVKMPQDKPWPKFRELLDVVCDHDVQGVTIANLRKDRSGMDIPVDWKGNLSGAPCWEPSNDLLEQTYRDYGSRLVLAGVGGVSTAEQAYWKIRHGASLVMLVSALIYRGPQVMTEIRRGVAALLRRDGFRHVEDAVGVDVD